MSSKDTVFSKLINTYNDFKNKEINNLDNKKKELKFKLDEALKKFNALKSEKEKLMEENKDIDRFLFSLTEILKARGIIFDIHNKNFKVKEWDNLHVEKIKGIYGFVTEKGEILYLLDKKYTYVMGYIINNFSYSIIIIRKDANLLKAQFRIIK